MAKRASEAQLHEVNKRLCESSLFQERLVKDLKFQIFVWTNPWGSVESFYAAILVCKEWYSIVIAETAKRHKKLLKSMEGLYMDCLDFYIAGTTAEETLLLMCDSQPPFGSIIDFTAPGLKFSIAFQGSENMGCEATVGKKENPIHKLIKNVLYAFSQANTEREHDPDDFSEVTLAEAKQLVRLVCTEVPTKSITVTFFVRKSFTLLFSQPAFRQIAKFALLPSYATITPEGIAFHEGLDQEDEAEVDAAWDASDEDGLIFSLSCLKQVKDLDIEYAKLYRDLTQ